MVADTAHPIAADVAHSLASNKVDSFAAYTAYFFAQVGTQAGGSSKVSEGPCNSDLLPAVVGSSNLLGTSPLLCAPAVVGSNYLITAPARAAAAAPAVTRPRCGCR